MSGDIPRKDQKILCLKSGNRCAMPNCHLELVIEKTESDPSCIIGQMAHIKGEKPGAARFDLGMTDKERNSHENLILLCANHHKELDDQPNTYTVEKLREIKKTHEKWVSDSLQDEVINVTFAELEMVTKYLVSEVKFVEINYTIIPHKEKITKNELSAETERWITTGLLQVRQVDQYIAKNPDLYFGERLKQGFVTEYERLKNEEGMRSDELFNSLWDFASARRNDFKNKAAGLAVLVYLFERCEVFEK